MSIAVDEIRDEKARELFATLKENKQGTIAAKDLLEIFKLVKWVNRYAQPGSSKQETEKPQKVT